jgi:hypothetical protein
MKSTAFALFLCSVAMSSAGARAEAPGGGARSAYSSPSTENVIELPVDQSSGVSCDAPIQVVVPGIGVFPAFLHGVVANGTCTPTAGKSPSDVASEPDYLQGLN